MPPSLHPPAATLPATLALLLMLAVGGCTQYYNIVQPPPAMITQGWNTAGSMALAGMPSAAGLQAGTAFALNPRTVISLGFNTTLLPTSISFIYYHPLGRGPYLSGQVHLSDLWFVKFAPFTPTVEVDLGLHVYPDPFYLSAHVGMAYFPDAHDGWWSRLNPLSGSRGASLVPCFGITAFLGPAVVGASLYPGRTRHFLEEYSYGILADGDSIVFAPAEVATVVDSAAAVSRDGSRELQRGELYLELRSGERVHILLRPELHPSFIQRAEGEIASTLARVPRDTSSPIRYYWVSPGNGRFPADARISQQVMALDLDALRQRYRQTGSVVIRNDLPAMDRLRSYSIPIQNDLSLAYGIWWYGSF